MIRLALRGLCAVGMVAAAAAGAASAQQPGAVSAADYARAETFMPYRTAPLVLNAVEDPLWQPDGRLRYRTRRAGGEELVLLDPRRGRREILPCRGAGARCGAVPRNAAGGAADESVSPDGRLAAFVRESNLWVRDLASGRERQLTSDGVKDFGYATDNPGWEHSNRAILSWSPDSRRIATFQQDQRGVADAYLIRTQPGHPQLESWKYAMAGDETIAGIQRVIIDVAAHRVVRLRIPPDPHRSSTCYDLQCGDGVLTDVQWSPDGAELAFVSTSRDHKRAQLRLADADTGAVRDVVDERAATYYESDLSSTTHGAVNWRYLPGSREVLWFSQRDGWAHLYLYDLASGRLKNRVTAGEWNVLEVLRVDAAARAVYFLGVGRERGRDPYFVHFYKVGLEGGPVTLLTPEDANHEILPAPAGNYFLDTYSRPDVPPVSVLRTSAGRTVGTVERADIAPLLATGWKPPQPVTVKARDGVTDLYGLMFTPTTFDPARRYPIVDWVYPGPHTGSVGSRAFTPSRGDRQALAELGFIVVAIDGMGTALRSKAFHDVSYDDMRDNTLPDQIAALEQLAARHAWIDLNRAGIYGHSGGGYAAATAMFLYPDFFKAGIAESGNHDPRGYTDDWAEKFMSPPRRRADGSVGYDGEDTLSIAKNLRGHLLLSHGTMDDNVPPNLTLLLVDALIKADKDFDLVMLPNQHHPYLREYGSYMTRRRWDFFVRHLLGAVPPPYRLQSPADDIDTEF